MPCLPLKETGHGQGTSARQQGSQEAEEGGQEDDRRQAFDQGLDAELMGENFARHRQPWKQEEIQKLHLLARKDMSLKAIAKALTRTEESVKDRAKMDGLKISKLR
jgi:hypothetical protein